MVLAIEPMVNAGKPAVKVLQDGWTAVTKDRSLSAHFEHTVVVTEDGCRVLTLPRRGDRGRASAYRTRALASRTGTKRDGRRIRTAEGVVLGVAAEPAGSGRARTDGTR